MLAQSSAQLGGWKLAELKYRGDSSLGRLSFDGISYRFRQCLHVSYDPPSKALLDHAPVGTILRRIFLLSCPACTERGLTLTTRLNILTDAILLYTSGPRQIRDIAEMSAAGWMEAGSVVEAAVLRAVAGVSRSLSTDCSNQVEIKTIPRGMPHGSDRDALPRPAVYLC